MFYLAVAAKKAAKSAAGEPVAGVDYFSVGWNVAGILFTVVIGYAIYRLTKDAMARRRQ